VCSIDIARLGQVKPGQRLTFRAIDVVEAHRLLREDAASLARAVKEETA
jgi:allophanate hydrolase subunit 2